MKKFPGETVSDIHFVGIGGIGMSGIADILVNLGYRVTGSDLKENAMTMRLSRKGVDIKIGHEAGNVRNASVVVKSSAISRDNPEILEARRLKIPVVKRAEMLAELMKMKNSIAVAGTHGKTTTTSLIATMLEQSNFDPTVVNGGVINSFNSNARLGAGEWIVVEADESDGSFTKLMSTIAVVTNIDLDHVDNYSNYTELSSMFSNFVENIPFYGVGVLCIDHHEVRKIALKTEDRKILTYGFSKDADVSCSNPLYTDCGSEFDVVFSKNIVDKYSAASTGRWSRFCVSMYGEHNVQNALAAIAVGLELGISEENMRIALGSFAGVKRRFTKVAKINGVQIIDDYAHHPVEIAAVLRAARQSCKGKIYAVMQAHRHTRLSRFLDDFANALQLSDYALLTPIYTAGEQNNGVDHFSLLRRMNEIDNVKTDFVQDVLTLKCKITKLVKPGDFIIFLGAGDITQWAYELVDLLKSDKNGID